MPCFICTPPPPPLNLVPPPIFNYQPKHNFVLNRIMFAQALTIVPHLSSSGLFGMVYEHLLGCFMPKDPSLRFSNYFKLLLLLFAGISLGRWP
jgi:hypothetical protein